MRAVNERQSDHPIDPVFLQRWSPRAFTGEGISEVELMTILEAARWAPSSYNSQPWRFLYARRETAHWDRFLDLLVPFNRGWAKDAGALVVLVSNPLMRPPGADKDVPSHSHSLDAGAASGFLALQANPDGQGARDGGARLTTLDPGAGYLTIINTYAVAPERAEALLDLLVRATAETLRYVPGFVSANFHVNPDRTQVVNYAQWRNREVLAAAGADPKVVARIREAAQIADSFTPVHYELRHSVAAP